MANHSLITLSNTVATRLTPLGLHSGMDITLQNVDPSAYIYVGGPGVNAENYGYRLSPGSAISFELPGRDNLYAISNINNSKVATLKTNLEAGL